MELDDNDWFYEHWRNGGRRYTHVLTGISVSQPGPTALSIHQIHADLRKQLAEKVAAHYASRSLAKTTAMEPQERPDLLSCTVPASEYIDRGALTQYVWKYCSEYLSSFERRVGSYTCPILGSDKEPSVQKIWRQLNVKYGAVPDVVVERAISNGRDEFRDNVCDRLLREHADVISVNRCPACFAHPARSNVHGVSTAGIWPDSCGTFPSGYRTST